MGQKGSSTLLEKKLLNNYELGDFFLATPSRTVLGKGNFLTVSADEETGNNFSELSNRVSALLSDAKKKGHKNPTIVGALPFDSHTTAKLVVPETLEISEPLEFDPKDKLETVISSTYVINPVPSPKEYANGVQKGINYIKTNRLKKIVLARSLQITLPEPVNVNQLIHNLAVHNKQGYTFAVDLPNESTNYNSNSFVNRKTLVGASPELLVSRSGLTLTANPLAGSRPRSKNAEEDKRRANELLSSTKDLHEHAVVVQAVANALKPYCRDLNVPEKPSLIHTETMWHLSTEITGQIDDPSISSLELALSLHPTPAVCGTPTDLAKQSINEIEPFDRNFFTGMVGWCDAKGDGEWIVTIRCAEVANNSLQLFAGAGVVGDSKPEEEVAETSAKFRTMLHAMGIDKESLDLKLEG